ncbi:MAG TPA: ABC transporter ATP-binding protein/permease [Candidatus Dorea faecigallinarum]|nr:ABC transporter ATP-binding protein/permease [Candidatus Dorea faecigallinarum]
MKTILSFLKPYRKRLLFISLIMIADVGGSLLVPTITANMINLAVSQANLSDILVQGIWMLGIALLSGGLTLLGSWLCARLSADFGRDLRVALYDKTLSFSTTDFETFGTASMITRTLNDINVLQQSLMNVLQLVLPVPVMCALGIFFSFSIHRDMGFLILGATFLVLAAALLIIRKAARIFELLQSFLDRMNVVLRENLTGVRVIRAFRKETHEIKRMRKSFEDYAISAIQANRLFAGLDCLATVVINLTIVAILYLGGNQIGTGSMKVGDITAVTEYAIWILFYVMMAQMVILLVPRAMTCMRRICAVLNHTPEIQDGTGQSGSGAGPEIFRFDHVSFRFADADENTLSDLSFSCEKGKTTAIIGGTGSGKSTIAKLLLRFHDVTAGQITLKGTDIRSLPQSELRSAISYIPQRAWLFSGTIEENLRYGNPDATREDLIRALKTAQADFVLDLPGGLKSHVSQGGTNFSGGQRQRLSIARALVKTADLYVFDDSFSALDFQTDAALRHALQEEITEAGLLIIAQRISTILHADQILVLNEGQIAGIGRHEELMETCPVYRDIAHSQMKGGN